MRVLLLATRHPYTRQSGRKTVLRTIVQSCQALGHEVRVLAITDEPTGVPGAPVEVLTPPGLPRVAVNVARRVLTGQRCLNECLYMSPSISASVASACSEWEPDVVIADMVRTAALALETGRPTVVDLDDLLSRRYRDLAGGRAEAGTVLGYYGSRLPGPLRAALAGIAARLIGIEARLVARREVEVARAAGAVSLVAAAEASSFSTQIGRPVASLPMAVELSAHPADVAANDRDRVVFVGGLDYHANLESVRMWIDEVAPALQRLGHDTVRLRVIGHCPPSVRIELGAAPSVELLGYVDDLDGELAGARAFVAPIPPGTGVKTKVLEAMAAGLPVVSTPDGVAGIGAIHGQHCLVGASGEQLAEAIARLMHDPALAEQLGRAARTLVAEQFSSPVVRERWRVVLDEVAAGGGRSQ